MDVFAALRKAGNRLRRNPILIATGVVEVVVLGGVFAAVLLPAAEMGSLIVLLSLWFVLVALWMSHLVLFPLDAFAFEQARGTPTREALRLIRDRGRSLFEVTAGERILVLVVGTCTAAVGLSVLLGVATVGRYVSLSGYQPFHLTFAAGAFAAGVLGVAAGTPFRFAAPLVLSEVTPRNALRESWRASCAAPRAVFSHALVRIAPFLVAIGAVLALPAASPSWLDVLLGGSLFLAGIALAKAHRAVIFERHVSPGHEASNGLETGSTSWIRNRISRRSVLVVLLVLAAITAGTGMVRVGETRPSSSPTYQLDGEIRPEAALENADQALGRVNYRRVRTTRAWNNSTDSWGQPTTFRSAVDHRDHQARITMIAPDTETSVRFFGGGTVGFRGFAPDPRRYGPFSYAAGNWTVVAVPGYRKGMGTEGWGDPLIPGPDAGWKVQERNADTIVLRLTANGLAQAEETAERSDVVVESDSWARVTLDRETGYLRRMAIHRNTTRYASGDRQRIVDRRRIRATVRFDYGVDVRRPAPFRRPSPLEAFIDALEY